MISLDEALALYAEQLKPLPPVRKKLAQALHHVLAGEVNSQIDLPLFTQSAVDGYAVRAADLDAARADARVKLKLVGEIAAGSPVNQALAAGCAFRIYTGGALPAGADACARQEIVERLADEIALRQPLSVGADTRFRGEEIKRGELIASAGQRIHSGLLAALVMAGNGAALVRPRPCVALLVSGDEVAEAGATLKPGQIHDANGPLVTAWLAEQGYPLVSSQRVRDEPALLREALAAATDAADVVLTTGGVSVGDRDYIPEVAQQLGYKQVFWKVAQKPGKPLWFGVNAQGKALLGFPGNPAAVLIGLHLHAARLLAVLEGERDAPPRWRQGVLTREIRADARDQLLRVAVESGGDGATRLTPLPKQDSHMLSNLARADGIVWVRGGGAEPHAAGSVVPWLALV